MSRTIDRTGHFLRCFLRLARADLFFFRAALRLEDEDVFGPPPGVPGGE